MPTVLIVEDFQPIRKLLCELLRPRHVCLAVGSAEEALNLLGRVVVDVVITDSKLPGMGGAEFIAEACRRHPEVPVIVTTGGDEGMFERDFRELGAFAYLLKPYRGEEVEALVSRAVECARSGKGRAAARRGRPPR